MNKETDIQADRRIKRQADNSQIERQTNKQTEDRHSHQVATSVRGRWPNQRNTYSDHERGIVRF